MEKPFTGSHDEFILALHLFNLHKGGFSCGREKNGKLRHRHPWLVCFAVS
jgi:hypothetical protein